MGYWYLGSPYSKYAAGLTAAHRDVCVAAALLIDQGAAVYSPIAHMHPVAIHGGLNPYDQSLWMKADTPMMEAADGLVVLMLDGWQDSQGLWAEIRHFHDARKPIVYMQPGKIPAELRRTA